MSRLLDIAKTYQPKPIDVPALRTECQRLHALVIRLRIESPKKGRAYALAYMEGEISKLADRCDVFGECDIPTGWHDPGDEFADGDQLTVLMREFNEVRAAGDQYPIALPVGCVLLAEANFDPFAVGRLYNGKTF